MLRFDALNAGNVFKKVLGGSKGNGWWQSVNAHVVSKLVRLCTKKVFGDAAELIVRYIARGVAVVSSWKLFHLNKIMYLF